METHRSLQNHPQSHLFLQNLSLNCLSVGPFWGPRGQAPIQNQDHPSSSKLSTCLPWWFCALHLWGLGYDFTSNIPYKIKGEQRNFGGSGRVIDTIAIHVLLYIVISYCTVINCPMLGGTYVICWGTTTNGNHWHLWNKNQHVLDTLGLIRGHVSEEAVRQDGLSK